MKIADGHLDLEFDVKHLGYFNFNDYYNIRNNLLKKYAEITESEFDESKFTLKLLKRGYEGFLESYFLYINNALNQKYIIDIEILLKMTLSIRQKQYEKKLEILKGLKVNEGVKIVFKKEYYDPVKDSVESQYITHIFQYDYVFTNQSQIHRNLLESIDTYIEDIENFQNEGSGWVIEQFKGIYMNIAGYQPMRGSSYIPLPEYIQNKKAVINPKNDDQMCFKWALGTGLIIDTIKHHPERNSKDKQETINQLINDDGINYPVEVNNQVYKKILKQNDFTFNVYSYDVDENNNYMFYPLFVVDQPKDKHINLLYFTSIVDNDQKAHYTFIKDFDKLLFDTTKKDHKKHICIKCLHNFSSKELLDNHLIDNLCTKKDATAKIILPEVGSTIKFNNIHKQLKAPFVIYADFECITEHIDDKDVGCSEYQKHIPSSFCFNIVSDFANFKPVLYRVQTLLIIFLMSYSKQKKRY